VTDLIGKTVPAPAAIRPASDSVKVVKALLRKPLAVISLLFLALVLFASLFPSVVAPDNPLAANVSAALEGPSRAHLLGTDELGRDVLSRLIYGGRPMIIASIEATVLALLLGTVGGMAAGYFRGRLDRTIGWVVDVVLSIPVMIVLLVVLTINSTDLTRAMVALGVLTSAVPLRVVRSVTLEARSNGYIAAARVAGLPHRRILVRHVLPRVYGPLIVQGALAGSVALMMVTGLAFLGLGVNPPNPTWGSMVSDAAQVMQQDSWLLVPTGGIVTLTVLCLGLFADAFRDVLAERASMSSPVSRSAAAASAAVAAEAAQAAADRAAFRPPRPDAVLSVRGLTIARRSHSGSVILVDGVNFDVMRGEILGIVGESGSGKTLTARAILNLLAPGLEVAAGEVLLDGTSLVNLSRRRLTGVRRNLVSFVAQDPSQSLDPSFSIGSTLREALKWRENLTGGAATSRAVELLRSVRLPNAEQLLHYYPYQVSGGMAQRVAIARALAGNPKLLVADEPTTALDVTVQSEILALLRSLRDDTGMAILFITHNWGAVADLCDRAAVMYAGEVVELGSVGELFARTLHPYTSALLRSSPYFSKPGQELRAIRGSVPHPTEWTQGCRFQDRCDFATDTCKQGAIALRENADNRAVRCIRAEELAQAGA